MNDRPFIEDQETPTQRIPTVTHRARPRVGMTPLAATVTIVVAIIVAFFALCVAALVVDGTGESNPTKPKRMELPRYVSECANEDGSGSKLPCYWDGGENGKGATYIVNVDGSTTQLVPTPN